ncbi:hypothetical protein W911_12640 [Hyphomicrobium nitrativorans NL23]|uniref:Uncharacterized protein n=1 Tax=Hyphomicrobium nitrativorans NL23 TaxID=1029756 RepID=V5SHA3_9HYPH|nr:hypothetical protein [Hyphomicrobium nitrativorans]AHB50266.1 hypothetical protein W911_12640 [Hyphomicrobium nitrativorans NL23]
MRLAAVVLGLAAPASASAEIHDYMIRRLLYLDTSCGVDQLERLPPPTESTRRFKALCRNVSAYPDGIVVTCTDIADDRSCKIETAPKTFDSLKLMRPENRE